MPKTGHTAIPRTIVVMAVVVAYNIVMVATISIDGSAD